MPTPQITLTFILGPDGDLQTEKYVNGQRKVTRYKGDLERILISELRQMTPEKAKRVAAKTKAVDLELEREREKIAKVNDIFQRAENYKKAREIHKEIKRRKNIYDDASAKFGDKFANTVLGPRTDTKSKKAQLIALKIEDWEV